MFTIVGYVVRSPIFFFFFLIGDLIEIGLRSAVFLPLISLQKGLKFASHSQLTRKSNERTKLAHINFHLYLFLYLDEIPHK